MIGLPSLRIGPREYLCGEGVIQDIGKYVANFGKKVLVIGGETALSVARDQMTDSFNKWGISNLFLPFKGFCSSPKIAAFREQVEKGDYHALVAVGGGKVMDCVKAVGYLSQKPVITIPTIAATCAAWSALSIIYSEDGVYESVLEYPNPPQMVLLDLEILVRAPARYLASGISDSLAKWYEISLNTSFMKDMSLSVATSLYLSRLSNRILREDGLAALEANQRHLVNASFVKMIDTIFLLVGVISGLAGETTRLAVAHTIYNCMSRFRTADGYLHGEKVAFGLAIQQILQGTPEQEVADFLAFLKALGVPTSLKSFGLTTLEQQEYLFTLVGNDETVRKAHFESGLEKIKQAFFLAEKLAFDTGKGEN
jgi:glycerol dehydrogenase-like iron-containing ADH family enzyme